MGSEGQALAYKRRMAFMGERRRLNGDISGKELQRALWTDPPRARLMPGIPRQLDYKGRQNLRKDCDEVFPQIMVGTGDCIKDLDYMLDLGITHIINTAEQDVRIDPTKFAKQGICYKGFIGSATIACAYLMLRKNYSATQALQYMRGSREVQPNLGFLQQLAVKDNQLRKDRYRKYNYKLEEIKYSI